MEKDLINVFYNTVTRKKLAWNISEDGFSEEHSPLGLNESGQFCIEVHSDSVDGIKAELIKHISSFSGDCQELIDDVNSISNKGDLHWL